jgi:hypothetical protein
VQDGGEQECCGDVEGGRRDGEGKLVDGHRRRPELGGGWIDQLSGDLARSVTE